MVVIHYTAMDSAEAARRTLCNPETEVSAHYLIGKDGTVMSLVAEEMRAWHAGAGAWGKLTDVNSSSIGIELDNNGLTPFSAPLMAALINLLQEISARWTIRPERIIGHSDMAPGRKIDPGLRFDWRRLWMEGLSVWPEVWTPEDPATFAQWMRRFGYTATTDDALLLDTFRRRFRPHATGPLDAVDTGMIRALAERYPVDAGTPTA